MKKVIEDAMIAWWYDRNGRQHPHGLPEKHRREIESCATRVDAAIARLVAEKIDEGVADALQEASLAEDSKSDSQP